MTWTIIIVILASARLTISLVRDDIFAPFRHQLFLRYPPEDDDRQGWFYQKWHHIKWHDDEGRRRREWQYMDKWLPRPPHFIGRLFSCPDCLGPWVATPFAAAYCFQPALTAWLSLPLAASMVASLLARRY